MNQDKIKEIKQKYPKGTRIMLNSMDDPHHPVPSGTLGTVETVDDIGTIHMKWDNGRSLGLIVGEDSFYVIESVQNQEKIREADEKIRVLVVEPMKEPKVEYIENTLDDMQRVVGGLIEEITLKLHRNRIDKFHKIISGIFCIRKHLVDINTICIKQ